MSVFYLDTSAFNRLFDSPSLKLLSELIQKRAVVYPSVFNVAELGSTSNEKRRVGLLKLTREISGNYRPLAMPSDLLRRSLASISVGTRNMDHSMGSEWDSVWIALNDSSLIDEEAHREVLEWKRQQEEWFQGMHDCGRPAVQEAINHLSTLDGAVFTSSFSKMIKFYPPKGEFVKGIVFDLAIRSGANVEINDMLVERILKHSEHWRFFLISMAYGLYSRSVKRTHFSRKKNPGSVDIQQAVYLAACDIFVTADNQQRRMLRLLLPFEHKKRRIWTYNEFEMFIKSLS